MKKVILVDGNNLLFRSYFATSYTGNIMRNSKGFPTNAVYGFINMINKIIHEENPEYMMIAFDKGKTFRHEKYKDYKGGRNETPDDLKQQFPVAKQICEAMGIRYFEMDNYEADDIIGTFARVIEENKEFNATIVSSDKDLLQLISDEIDVKLLKQTGFIRMDRALFKETYQVEPIGMIDLKALMGDSSDNIPGVKGIGEKTAIQLLSQYQTIDNLYEHIEEIKGKTKEKLIADKENAYMSRDIATIYREVPIDTELEHIRYSGIDALEYIRILEELEFYSLIKKLDIKEETLRQNQEKELDVVILDSIQNLHLPEKYAIYLEMLGENYHKVPAIGFGIYGENTSLYIPFDLLQENPDLFLGNEEKYTYDLKKLWYVLKREGFDIKNCNFDTMIAGYLLNYPIKDDIAHLARTGGYSIPFYEEIYGKREKEKLPELEVIAKRTVEKARYIYETRDQFFKELQSEDALLLFQNIEMPLVNVLRDMEQTGVQVDSNYLKKMGEELDQQIITLEQEIFEISKENFNIASPKQLGIILFEKLQIPYPKKVKNGSYSTSKDILDKLAPDYPIVAKVLDYRMLTKLKATYITGLLGEILEDGRVHTIFNQTLTRTGRLSSISPNLQNIPIRTEEGRLIRKAFTPDKNSIILSSDYSQIELRIFASLANVDNLIKAFQENKDIHAKTASDIFHIPLESVTKDMRRTAKAVNFGILYGISSFGLSEDLGIDIISAKAFIDGYLDTYPEIKQYMDETVKKAYADGYVKTVMNRKRTIDELKNKNYLVRSQGERIALNTPIQGSSADILKKAMIEIFNEFEEKGLKSKMLIQVHDELVFNVILEEKEIVTEIVKRIMENTYQLNVPLVVDIESGNDWYEAK